MSQVPLKTTDHLGQGDRVYHPLTDEAVTVKSVREAPHQVNRYDVRFEEKAPIVFDKHAAALWRLDTSADLR